MRRFLQQLQEFAGRPTTHVAALFSFAVAQPLFDVLGDAPEFLLAHDLAPDEILAVAALLGLVIPLTAALVAWLCTRIGRSFGNAVTAFLIALPSALIALATLKAWESGPAAIIIALSCVAGLLVSLLYLRQPGVRAFLAVLTPAILLFPVMFVLRPGVSRLIWPEVPVLNTTAASATPVVMVVFDGLPLGALLDGSGRIDRNLYPSFASLADSATWYRNATTVSDYTRWAVPAIMTGRYPVAEDLPIASDHPESIFTLLASSHEFVVSEPISRLCPESICQHERTPLLDQLRDFGGTLWVVYLHAILPSATEADLPPVNQGWAEGNPSSVTPSQLWLEEGPSSRRGEWQTFLNGVGSAREKPGFYYVHALLPHTPLSYFPSGQRYAAERYLPGLEERRDYWKDDDWAVAQGHQRFLWQAGSVDTLLGQLVARLKESGLYDESLIVVTSDHGASFVASQPFRRLTPETAMDILPVPLFIKTPDQRTGTVSDQNVQSIDILPTIARLLGVEIPWQVDGAAVGSRTTVESRKAFFDDARQSLTFEGSLLERLSASVARTQARFESESPYRYPRTAPFAGIRGKAVESLRTGAAPDDVEFLLQVHGDFRNVAPDAPFVPGYLAGRARKTTGGPVSLAIAVNGTVAATTRTYQFEHEGSGDAWAVVLAPDVFRPGGNDVEIFVIAEDAGGPVLHPVHRIGPSYLNLTSPSAEYAMGVRTDGLYPEERGRAGTFRWTRGDARVTIPAGSAGTPAALRLVLAMAGRDGKSLRVAVNGCNVFEGPVRAGAWTAVFPLGNCQLEEGADLVITLQSDTHHNPQSRDTRVFGVAVEKLNLLSAPWPPSGAAIPAHGRRARLEILAPADAALTPSGAIGVRVANLGSSVWPAARDLQGMGSVRLSVRWWPEAGGDEPAAEHFVDLAETMFPGDVATLEVPLAAGRTLANGTYSVEIGLEQAGAERWPDSVRHPVRVGAGGK